MPVTPGYNDPRTAGMAPRDDFADQVSIGQQNARVSVAGTNTSQNQPAIFIPANQGNWILPVIGMRNAPSQFQGNAPAWATGSFGYQKPASKGGHVHQGVDIYAQAGTGVVAPVAGTVTSMGEGAVSGKYVKVRGDDGYEYYYAHLESIHTGISRGQRVGAGAYLGGVGNSGNASGTSAHLHFEVRKGGKSVNPNGFIQTGRTQETTPMSAIAGLNTTEELQAYIDEQVRAAQVMMQGAEGFDPATWNQQAEQLSEEDMIREQTARGQNILGSTLTAMSSSIGGGSRTPMQKGTTAMSAIRSEAASGGAVQTPTAEQVRPTVESEEA